MKKRPLHLHDIRIWASSFAEPTIWWLNFTWTKSFRIWTLFLSSGLFLFFPRLLHWGKYVHHINALEKKVCTVICICIIVALLPFHVARWLFATGVNTYASDSCFVFGRFPSPPPFSVAHEWSGSYLRSYLCGSLEIGANFIPWQHRQTTSLCWQRSPKSRPVGIGHRGVTVQFRPLTNESTVKTALQQASVFILPPIPATWDSSFCIDEHPLLSLVAWNKRAESLWPPQVWSSTEN